MNIQQMIASGQYQVVEVPGFSEAMQANLAAQKALQALMEIQQIQQGGGVPGSGEDTFKGGCGMKPEFEDYLTEKAVRHAVHRKTLRDFPVFNRFESIYGTVVTDGLAANGEIKISGAYLADANGNIIPNVSGDNFGANHWALGLSNKSDFTVNFDFTPDFHSSLSAAESRIKGNQFLYPTYYVFLLSGNTRLTIKTEQNGNEDRPTRILNHKGEDLDIIPSPSTGVASDVGQGDPIVVVEVLPRHPEVRADLVIHRFKADKFYELPIDPERPTCEDGQSDSYYYSGFEGIGTDLLDQ